MLAKAKALAAASVVGLAGVAMSDDAAAQHTYVTPTYGGNTQTHVVVSGQKAITGVIGAAVANKVFSDVGAPVKVVGADPKGRPVFDINMNQMPPLKVTTGPGVVETITNMGLAYSNHPFYITNPRNPNIPGQRLIAEPGTTNIVVTKGGEANVFVELTYLKNNLKFIERWVVGVDANGMIVSGKLGEQIVR